MSGGKLSSRAEGEIEAVDGVLVIKRIHVQYQLRPGDADPDAIQRAMEKHPRSCPVYRSLHPQIDISLSLELIDD